MELLAPAGTMENFLAAIDEGADAIYLGGQAFNARKFAANFSTDELVAGLRIAHLFGVKVYVTVNIIIGDVEMEELRQYLIELERIGVDGILVQDMAVAVLAKQIAPNLPLHGSTQMTVTNLGGVDFLQSLGFTRVVLAREMSLDEIEQICCHTSMEIEVFVHGAICVCYSGQCLMSSLMGGRSGNRGSCAQPCRLPYTLINEKGTIIEEKSYLMSPKDMNTAKYIKQLAHIGVAAVKIEGRMKQVSYVRNIVGAYRHVIDCCTAGKSSEKAAQSVLSALEKSFNRGYTSAYLTDQVGKAMMSCTVPNNQSKEIKTVEAHTRKINITMTVDATIGTMLALTVTDENGRSARVISDHVVEEARTQPTKVDAVRKQLSRLGHTVFFLEDLVLQEQRAMLPASVLNDLRRQGVAAIENVILGDYDRKQAAEWQPYGAKQALPVSNGSAGFRPAMPCVDVAIGVRVNTLSGVQVALTAGADYIMYGGENYDNEGYCSSDYQQIAHEVRQAGKELIFTTPRVLRQREVAAYQRELEQMIAAAPDAISLGSFGTFTLLQQQKNIIPLWADFSLNIFNTSAAQYYESLGLVTIGLSPEATLSQIRKIAEQVAVPVEVMVQGRLEMMVTEHCLISSFVGSGQKKNCARLCRQGHYFLRDRKGENLPIVTDQFCRSHILNSKDLDMTPHVLKLKDAGIRRLRIECRGQEDAYVSEKVRFYRDLLSGRRVAADEDDNHQQITRGHYFKGVL